MYFLTCFITTEFVTFFVGHYVLRENEPISLNIHLPTGDSRPGDLTKRVHGRWSSKERIRCHQSRANGSVLVAGFISHTSLSTCMNDFS